LPCPPDGSRACRAPRSLRRAATAAEPPCSPGWPSRLRRLGAQAIQEELQETGRVDRDGNPAVGPALSVRPKRSTVSDRHAARDTPLAFDLDVKRLEADERGIEGDTDRQRVVKRDAAVAPLLPEGESMQREVRHEAGNA